jgi:glycosyltransferase involved in cell wall biosynthesis
MRVAIIVDAYKPFNSSAAIQIEDLANEFVLQGHEVILVTPASGQKQSWVEEVENGVNVLRLSAPITKNIGRIRRAVSEMLLPFFMLWGFRRSPYFDLKLDGIIWYSPTIFFGPFVHFLKRKNHCSGYLILRDIFPDIAIDLGILKRGLIYRFFKVIEGYQYSLADFIGVQSESNLEYLHDWAKQPKRHLEVLHNWLTHRLDVKSKFSIADSSLAGKKVMVYSGNMGLMQGIDIVLDLAASLLVRDDVGILLLGRGSEVPRLKREAATRGLNNILFHDEIPSSEVPAVLLQCHIGLLLLDPRLKTHNIPGKLISYMHAGLPILGRINLGNDLLDIIKDNEIGFAYAGEENEEFLLKAELLLNDHLARAKMSANSKAKVAELFSSAAACKQITMALVD